MQFKAYRSWRTVVPTIAGLLLSAYWVCETVRVALVETWINSNQVRNLERAMALDPDNPEIYYRTGTLYLLGMGIGPSDPVSLLRKATDLNPKIGKYWLSLGRACFVARDQECADQALKRALQLSPMTPSIAWQAATYEVFTGRFDDSFTQFKRLLYQDPQNADDIFRFTWRAFDPEITWRKIVADIPDTRLKCRYLVFLAQNRRFDIAASIWAQIVSAPVAPSFDEAKTFLEQLLQARRFGEGLRVWRDLVCRSSLSRPDDDTKDNLVFNGSFESLPLNAGFDWNSVPPTFVTTDFSDTSAQSGKHALRVEYTLPHNTEGEAAYELVPVDPNQKYVLTAYSRSDELTSDSGPQLRIQDAQCPACLDVVTSMTLGTTPWHPLRLVFTTGPKTEMVRLSVWRSRSRTFPTEISGSFWLDTVCLRQDAAAATARDNQANIASSNLP